MPPSRYATDGHPNEDRHYYGLSCASWLVSGSVVSPGAMEAGYLSAWLWQSFFSHSHSWTHFYFYSATRQSLWPAGCYGWDHQYLIEKNILHNSEAYHFSKKCNWDNYLQKRCALTAGLRGNPIYEVNEYLHIMHQRTRCGGYRGLFP